MVMHGGPGQYIPGRGIPGCSGCASALPGPRWPGFCTALSGGISIDGTSAEAVACRQNRLLLLDNPAARA